MASVTSMWTRLFLRTHRAHTFLRRTYTTATAQKHITNNSNGVQKKTNETDARSTNTILLTFDGVREILENPKSQSLRAETIKQFINQKNVKNDVAVLEEMVSLAKKHDQELFSVYKNLILACFEASDFDKARKVVSQARRDKMQFEEHAWTNAINSRFSTNEQRALAQNCLYEFQKPTTIVGFNTALSSALADEDVPRMTKLLHEMKMQGIKPSQHTYQLMFSKAYLEGQPEKALALYNLCKKLGIELKRLSYRYLILALSPKRIALEIFQEATAKSAIHDVMTVNTILNSLEDAGDMKTFTGIWDHYYSRGQDGKYPVLQPTLPSFMSGFKCCTSALSYDLFPKEAVIAFADRLFAEFVLDRHHSRYNQACSHLIRYFCTIESPKAVEVFQEHFPHLERRFQMMVITMILKLAVKMSSKQMAEIAVKAAQSVKIQLHQTDYYYLVRLYVNLNELDVAFTFVQKMWTLTEKGPVFDNGYDAWANFRKQLALNNRLDLLERLNIIYPIPVNDKNYKPVVNV